MSPQGVAGMGLAIVVLLVAVVALGLVVTATVTALVGVIVRGAEWYMDRRAARRRREELSR